MTSFLSLIIVPVSTLVIEGSSMGGKLLIFQSIDNEAAGSKQCGQIW